MTFGDYVVFVDESGDHSLTSVNAEYPVLVLAFCVFEKERYAARVLPAVTRLKFQYFGHDAVVLNDRELELAFRRVCQGSNATGSALALSLVMMDKKANSADLQFSDLVARPIGRHALLSDQPNRAWDILQGMLGTTRRALVGLGPQGLPVTGNPITS